MDQIPIISVLRRHAWMIIALCVVATVGGYAFSFLIAERYSATALVLVRPQQPIKISSEKAGKEMLEFPIPSSTSVETPAKTYIEIIKSSELIGQVVRTLKLDEDKDTESGRLSKFLPPYIKDALSDLKQSFKDLTEIIKYGRLIEEDAFTKTVKGVQDDLT